MPPGDGKFALLVLVFGKTLKAAAIFRPAVIKTGLKTAAAAELLEADPVFRLAAPLGALLLAMVAATPSPRGRPLTAAAMARSEAPMPAVLEVELVLILEAALEVGGEQPLSMPPFSSRCMQKSVCQNLRGAALGLFST